jgi:phosphatidylglycerol:prolipoprotein diacylglycerol transferase
VIQPQIQIGPLTVHLYGLIIAAAVYIGYILAKKRAKLYNIKQKIFDDPMLLLPLALTLIGARAYHVADYWQVYRQNPVEIVYIANGGLGIWGAIAGLILGLFIVCKIRKIDLFSALDLMSPPLLLGQAIGRIGNYVNQEGFGPPTRMPWGVYISPDHRPAIYSQYNFFHPTFFYEATLDLIFFIALIYFEKRSQLESKKSVVSGQLFALYLIFYSTARFISEFWRIDTATVGHVKVAQVISALVFACGAYLLFRKRFHKSPQNAS